METLGKQDPSPPKAEEKNPIYQIELPRKCGSCTACCKTHPVLELNKPARTWCEHCRIGSGCKIYGEHPQGCKDFACQWLFGIHSKDERPDKVKVVTDVLVLPIIGNTVSFFEVSEGSLDKDFVTGQTSALTKQGLPVCHLPINGKNKLFLPKNIKTPSGYFIHINDKETDIIFV